MIFGPVEGGRAQPVLPGEIGRVPDAHQPLLGTVDEKQAAERPEGLAAEILLALLVDDDDHEAAIGRFRRRHQTGQPGADDQTIAVHAFLPCLDKQRPRLA